MTVTTNDTLILNCTAVNNTDAPNPLRFTWIQNGTSLQDPVTQETVVDNRTITNCLIVANVTRENAGVYHCAVDNREFADAVRSADAEVVVNC